MKPFAQQPLGELGITPLGPHEVGERAEDSVAEPGTGLEQGLGGWREADPFAIEFCQCVPSSRHLREFLFGLPTRRSRVGFCGFRGGRPAARLVDRLRRRARRASQRYRVVRPSTGLEVGGCFRGGPRCPLARRLTQLLTQLGPFPLERRPLALASALGLGPLLKVLLEEPDGRALIGEAGAHRLLPDVALLHFALHAPELARGRLVLGVGRVPLPLGLGGAPVRFVAVEHGLAPPLTGISHPLRRKGEVPLDPADGDLRIRQLALYFGTRSLGAVARL